MAIKDTRGYHYEVTPNGTPKMVVTELKRTKNLPPPKPDFEGIRIENGKPVFHFSEASKKFYAKLRKDNGGVVKLPERKADVPPPKVATTPAPRPITANQSGVVVRMTEGDEGGKRYSIFGFNVTSVVRWMGKDAWTFQQARRAMRKLNLPVADATLQAQLRAGHIGTRGDPAKLTAEQVECLYALIETPKEEKPCPTSPKASAKTSPAARPAANGGSSTPPKSARTSPSSPAKPARKSSTSKSGKSRKSKSRK